MAYFVVNPTVPSIAAYWGGLRIYVGMSCFVKRNPSSGEPWKSQDEGEGEKKSYTETHVRLDGYGVGRREDAEEKMIRGALTQEGKVVCEISVPRLFAEARQLWLRPIPSRCCAGSFHFLFVYVW